MAAAKLGANVTMIGKVGTDEHGELLINSLRSAGVSTAGIRREGTTGMAFISVSDEGENHIVLVAGANSAMRRSDISAMKGLIEESDMIIMQLEIPLEVVKYALELAVGIGKNVILNPAPGTRFTDRDAATMCMSSCLTKPNWKSFQGCLLQRTRNHRCRLTFEVPRHRANHRDHGEQTVLT